MKTFVGDITDASCFTQLFTRFDFATLIFALSAITPEKMPSVANHLKSVLKPGGKVLFRDYAESDLAERRFEGRPRKKLGEHFYLRSDGTRCFYFTIDFLCNLFTTSGFLKERVVIVQTDVHNQKRQLTMKRRWIEAVFVKL